MSFVYQLEKEQRYVYHMKFYFYFAWIIILDEILILGLYVLTLKTFFLYRSQNSIVKIRVTWQIMCSNWIIRALVYNSKISKVMIPSIVPLQKLVDKKNLCESLTDQILWYQITKKDNKLFFLIYFKAIKQN